MDRVEIVEVGPRDGLQNESRILATDQKLRLIAALVEAGVRRLEAVSFAHPKLVPQMADAEAVMAGVERRPEVTYIGLVMNRRGWERAVAAAVDEVSIPVMASETFNRRNQGAGTYDTIELVQEVVALAAGRRVSAVIGTTFDCAFEGEIPLERVLEVADACLRAGVSELALADTIGVADPWAVADRLGAVAGLAGDVPLRAHFHNTRNTGLANAHAAVQVGVAVLDASVGGVGGCPFAPAATGNIPTDDLVYMLERAGFATGIHLERLIGVSVCLAELLGRELPAMVGKAGLFPA